MGIQKARNGEVEIAYEVFGPPTGTPLLLIMGSGGQLVMWPQVWCRALVERGFQVVRMDNRDTGPSTHLGQYDKLPRKQRPAYTLADMADDVIAVFDALGWSGGHLMGGSLGGMIAQVTAARHPDRVRSVTMQSVNPSSSILLSRPRPRTALRAFRAISGKPRDRDDYGEKWARLFSAVASPVLPEDLAHWREAGRIAFDRGLNPRGDLRHTAALLAAGDRRPLLAEITCPAVVIHGKLDGMCHWKAGKATADAIPGARFVLYPEMGHVPASTQWPAIVDEVSTVATLRDEDRRSRGAGPPPGR
ncbi:alpha/beta hydrolase [Actinophytocola sp.]|uniref:alpha/beta fold hydrolase n=1 Tax=Actinophytocola sp. TaxID=1872138 RepID=UPI003D6A52B9